MAFKSQPRPTLASSCESLDDAGPKLEQGLDALSTEGQEQVCEFYQCVNQHCPQLLPSVQEMLAQILKDVRHHKADQARLLRMLSSAKHEHHEQLRKMEEEVEQQIQKIKLEERCNLENQFKTILRAKDVELEELRNGVNRLEETLNLASAAKNGVDESTMILRSQVSSLQQENCSVKVEMSEILTQLELMRNELGTLKQEYQEVSRELNKTKIVAIDRSRENEQSARQIAVLEWANRKLRDANDELRMALESSREGRKVAKGSMSSLREEEAEPCDESSGLVDDRASSTGRGVEGPSRRLALLRVSQPGDIVLPPGDSLMSLTSYTHDENLLPRQHAVLGGKRVANQSDHPQFLRIDQEDGWADVDHESEVDTNRLSSLYNLNNYQLLNTHGGPLKLPKTAAPSHSHRSNSRGNVVVNQQQVVNDLPETPSTVSSGVGSDGCGGKDRTGDLSESESNETVKTSASQLSVPTMATIGSTRHQLPSTDNGTDDEIEDDSMPSPNEEADLRFSRGGRQRVRRKLSGSMSSQRSSNQSPNAASRHNSGSKAARNSEAVHVGEPTRMYKIVLAGDSAVGKSSFLTRLCKNSFQQHCTSTLGVDFHTKLINLDGQTVALQLWDTAGQERFRSIANSYFRRADGVLLLYDVTYERSFLNVRQWISSIADVTDKRIPIMLVANKIDLRNKQELDGIRCVRYEDGLTCARENNTVFVECSAKDGTNVVSAIEDLARTLRINEDLEVKNLGMPIRPDKIVVKSSETKKLNCCN